ncbi:MAG: hypothetical protein Q8891_05455 [Bacteroidota bacterium]|nr:hypothetical protein [Bacteroidota bacterium]
MKLKFLNPDKVEKNIKGTIHKSGKLGFTIQAANKLQLNKGKSVGIAINEDDESDKNLYIEIYSEKKEHSLPILKAGDYFYVNTKDLFDSLKFDYINNYITFDISELEISGNVYFKFKFKERKRKESIQ